MKGEEFGLLMAKASVFGMLQGVKENLGFMVYAQKLVDQLPQDLQSNEMILHVASGMDYIMGQMNCEEELEAELNRRKKG